MYFVNVTVITAYVYLSVEYRDKLACDVYSDGYKMDFTRLFSNN